MTPVHIPVLADRVAEYLVPQRGDALIIDGTLGEGGHSARFLDTYPGCRVTGIDADLEMGKRACERLAIWKNRLNFINGWTDEILESWDGEQPDVILMDLGISTWHYAGSGRGFSFQSAEALDMRLDESSKTAAALIKEKNETELADMIYQYGEERYSRRIARKIVEERQKSPITDTERLAAVVLSAVPPQYKRGRLHPATRTFQALRIAVNSELERLKNFLLCAPQILRENGLLGIISFHSLEDRMVKHSFRDLGSGGDFEVVTRKPLVPGEQESRNNPASRSAKFRVLRKKAGRK